jgi:hypothetical protein
MLVKLVQLAFQQAQWGIKVGTGRYTFPPADNGRNVRDKVSEASLQQDVAEL